MSLIDKLNLIGIRFSEAWKITKEDYRLVNGQHQIRKGTEGYHSKQLTKAREIYTDLTFPVQFLSRIFGRDFWNVDSVSYHKKFTESKN